MPLNKPEDTFFSFFFWYEFIVANCKFWKKENSKEKHQNLQKFCNYFTGCLAPWQDVDLIANYKQKHDYLF